VVKWSVYALSVVDHEFNHQLGQTKDNEIGISCFSVMHAELRTKNKCINVRFDFNTLFVPETDA
jgi:predicted DNA binding CopG/RHH family protein